MVSREEIVDQSFALFRQYGVKSVTLDDISGRLGVSKKTLYEHFKNKEDLLRTGLVAIFDEIRSEISIIIDSENDAVTKLLRIYGFVLQLLMDYNSSYFFSITRFSDDINKIIYDFKEEFLEQFVKPLFFEARSHELMNEQVDIDAFIDLYLRDIELRVANEARPHTNLTPKSLYFHLIVIPFAGISKNDLSWEECFDAH